MKPLRIPVDILLRHQSIYDKDNFRTTLRREQQVSQDLLNRICKLQKQIAQLDQRRNTSRRQRHQDQLRTNEIRRDDNLEYDSDSPEKYPVVVPYLVSLITSIDYIYKEEVTSAHIEKAKKYLFDLHSRRLRNLTYPTTCNPPIGDNIADDIHIAQTLFASAPKTSPTGSRVPSPSRSLTISRLGSPILQPLDDSSVDPSITTSLAGRRIKYETGFDHENLSTVPQYSPADCPCTSIKACIDRSLHRSTINSSEIWTPLPLSTFSAALKLADGKDSRQYSNENDVVGIKRSINHIWDLPNIPNEHIDSNGTTLFESSEKQPDGYSSNSLAVYCSEIGSSKTERDTGLLVPTNTPNVSPTNATTPHADSKYVGCSQVTNMKDDNALTNFSVSPELKAGSSPSESSESWRDTKTPRQLTIEFQPLLSITPPNTFELSESPPAAQVVFNHIRDVRANVDQFNDVTKLFLQAREKKTLSMD